MYSTRSASHASAPSSPGHVAEDPTENSAHLEKATGYFNLRNPSATSSSSLRKLGVVGSTSRNRNSAIAENSLVVGEESVRAESGVEQYPWLRRHDRMVATSCCW